VLNMHDIGLIFENLLKDLKRIDDAFRPDLLDR